MDQCLEITYRITIIYFAHMEATFSVILDAKEISEYRGNENAWWLPGLILAGCLLILAVFCKTAAHKGDESSVTIHVKHIKPNKVDVFIVKVCALL